MKNKQEQKPTGMNPNDSDFVSRNKMTRDLGGTGQNYSGSSGLQSANQTSSNSVKERSSNEIVNRNTGKK